MCVRARVCACLCVCVCEQAGLLPGRLHCVCFGKAQPTGFSQHRLRSDSSCGTHGRRGSLEGPTGVEHEKQKNTTSRPPKAIPGMTPDVPLAPLAILLLRAARRLQTAPLSTALFSSVSSKKEKNKNKNKKPGQGTFQKGEEKK